MLGEYEYRNPSDERRQLSSGNQYAVVPSRYNYNVGYDEAAESSGVDVARYWRILLKHRWLVLSSVIGALAIGLAVTLLMTPVYHAEATLKIDREADRIVNVQEVQPVDSTSSSEEFYQTQYGMLKSRSLAMGVIDRLGLASSPAFFKSMGVKIPNISGNSQGARELAVKIFQKNLSVSPVRGSRLVKIGFDSPDPQLAANISNAICQEFIESNLTSWYDSSGYARTFLEKMLAETKEKLEASERAASDYATREGIINVVPTSDKANSGSGTQNLQVTSLVALNSSLSSAQAERIKAEQRYRQSMTAEAASLPEVLQNPTIQALNQSRAKVQGEYEEKSKTYRPDYPELVAMRGQIDELNRQIHTAMLNVQSSLKLNYEVALSQERSFEAQVQKDQAAALNMDQRSIELGILQREADTNRSLYDGLLQRYKEIGVTGGIKPNNISFVDHAETPHVPAKPRPVLNMFIAGLAGVGLGIVLTLLLELLDESIATPEDLESKLGIPMLGSVPKLSRGESPAELMNDQRSAFSEAYYSIRTALQFSTAQGAPTSLLVTSSRPSEGKSTTAMAVATNFARIGINVLLVDADMRNPSLHRVLGIENTEGLSNVLTGAMDLRQATRPTSTPNLHFLPCGPLPPNPAELLAGHSLKAFIESGLQVFSMVIIDGPPVLGLADAPTLAAAVAGTIMVVESRGTRRGPAKAAIHRLQLGQARLLGGILTKFDAKRSSYGYGAGYAYAYEYNYGERPRIKNS